MTLIYLVVYIKVSIHKKNKKIDALERVWLVDRNGKDLDHVFK